MPRPFQPLVRLVFGLAVMTAPLALGCEDPPPSAMGPERYVAEADWGPLSSAGRGAPAAESQDVWLEDGARSTSGFTIEGLELSSPQVAGNEAFFATVRVAAPMGQSIKAYGLKTPYEEGVRAFKALPMAMRDGVVRIKVDGFATVPRTGVYPLEFWLINDSNHASNRVRGEVTVR